MLAELGHCAVAVLRAVVARRWRRIRHRARGRSDINPPQVRVARKQSSVIHARKCDFGGGKPLGQCRLLTSSERRGDPRVGVLPSLYPFHVGCEILIRCKRMVAQNLLGQDPPFPITLDGDQNVGTVPLVLNTP
jgi:hypothetical protein